MFRPFYLLPDCLDFVAADLAMEWDSFRAARAALAGVVSVSRARDVAATITSSIPDYHSQLAAHLSKGHLTVISSSVDRGQAE